MTMTIYGIRNCDTMKRARAWLDARGVDYAFHDYKKEGVARDRLAEWVDRLGWEALVNRAGTTFRKLPDADKAGSRPRPCDRADAGEPVHDQTSRAGTG